MNKNFIRSIPQMLLLAITISLSGISALGQNEKEICPTVSITSPFPMFLPKQNSTVRAQISGKLPEKASLIWGTSLGNIVSGFGTREINVFFTKENQGSNVSVFLRIENLPETCTNTFSETFVVAVLPIVEPADSFPDASRNDIRARIDNLYIQINNYPLAEGLVIASLNKKQSENQKLRTINYILDAVRFRNYDITRLSFLTEETKEKNSFVLWTFRPEGDLPGDLEKTNLIKGEELVKNIRKALPKRECKCAPQPK